MEQPKEITVVEKKPWYKSATLWGNLGAVLAGLGVAFETDDAQPLMMSGLAVVNMLWRYFATRSPIR